EAAAAGAKGMHSASHIAPVNALDMGIYPNPTTGPTRISVTLPANASVSMSIYNAAGQIVYSESGKIYSQGYQIINWDGKGNNGADVESGYYYVKVSAGTLTSVDKLVLMR
ncbi:MAG: FlgD immunoglobulin-like domain containing protein, partial [Bacteroidota bacterium]